MGDNSKREAGPSRIVSGYAARKERLAAQKEAAGASAGSSETRNITADTEVPEREPPNKVVVEDIPPRPVDLPGPRKKDQNKAKSAPKPPEQQVIIPSAQARDMLIFMFNSLAAMFIGDYARLSEQEYHAINAPLERILQRMPQEMSSKVGEYADPMMLCMGMAMWGFRVFVQVPRIMRQQQEAATLREFEKSISRDVPLDPQQSPARTTPPPTPHQPINPTPNGENVDIPTGIRPDFQQLWEQKLEGE